MNGEIQLDEILPFIATSILSNRENIVRRHFDVSKILAVINNAIMRILVPTDKADALNNNSTS